MKRFIVFFLMIAGVAGNTYAQSIKLSPTVIPTQGQNSKVGNFGLSWTVGQPFNATTTNGNFKVTQGFQQPFYPNEYLSFSPIQMLEFSDNSSNSAAINVTNILKFQVMNFGFLPEDSMAIRYHVIDTISGAEVISENYVKYSGDGNYYIDNLSTLSAGLKYQLEFIVADENKFYFYIIRN